VTGVAELFVRTATPEDATRLISIRSAVIEHDLATDQFVHHLAIPSGADYFCLAAELSGRVIGYLSAGGCRDADHKSYGEFYELAVEPGPASCSATIELASAGHALLVDARYGGIIAWLDEDAVGLIAVLEMMGFALDKRDSGHRSRQRRYRVPTSPPSCRGRSG
jgi:hypothetical protein